MIRTHSLDRLIADALARSRNTGLLNIFAFSLTILAGSIPVGCVDDDDATTDPPCGDFAQPTLEQPLLELRRAYRDNDLDLYATSLDDDFHFVFDPQDVVETPGMPVEWSLSDELRSTRNMFEDSLVERTQVDFVIHDPAMATLADAYLHPFPPGTMKVTLQETEIRIDARDPEGGENIVYAVSGGIATVFLAPDSTEMICELPVWRIVEWRDRRIGNFSWGQVKWAYRRR